MPRFNHALTLAYVVHSEQETMPTEAETWAALLARVEELRNDTSERTEALMCELPFDTVTEEEG